MLLPIVILNLSHVLYMISADLGDWYLMQTIVHIQD